LRLDQLPARQSAIITDIDWDQLTPAEARRLQEFGFGVGMPVEVSRRAGIFGGPLACRIGRMTVAIRRINAAAILVNA
jgi:ferrous iron transport protein A